jgi:hypothetical protein
MKKTFIYAGMISVMLSFVFVFSGCENVLEEKEYRFTNLSSYVVTLHDNTGDKSIPINGTVVGKYDIINRIEDVKYSPSDKVAVKYDEETRVYIFYNK